MPPRVKKLIGLAVFLPYFAVYLFAAAALGERVPQVWPLQVVYYVAAGLAWAWPLKRAMVWMNAEPASAAAEDTDAPEA
ncbi:MAG: DUF2842 domain-containing protein [Parvularculaceae bacterium]